MYVNSTVLVAIILLLPLFSTAPVQADTWDQFNGTTYRLSRAEAEIILPVEGSNFNVTLPVKSEIRLFDSKGEEVPINSTVDFWRGTYKYKIVVNESVEGHLNYSMPIHDQRFFAPVNSIESVRVFLPQGYTTGNHLLGRPRPTPDEILEEGERLILVWDNPKTKAIDVGYYKNEAPRTFLFIFMLLAFLGGIVVLEYVLSIKKLRSIRESVDRDA